MQWMIDIAYARSRLRKITKAADAAFVICGFSCLLVLLSQNGIDHVHDHALLGLGHPSSTPKRRFCRLGDAASI
jgi:non-ribosomal peptide synthetase component F